jgi:ABC-type cobalamin/Fe3+-siderophores transport system ATPase subunit
VLLAACLAQDAAILLLDEPSTFLDVGAQLECFALLRDQAARGRLCIAVTHDLNLALAHATRLLVLDGASIAHDLSVADIGGDSGWLRIFSPRLRLSFVEAGAPRVWYA